MNKVVMIGRLTKDADIRYLQNENSTCVAKFNLAVDRKIKRNGEPTADFLNCVAFGKVGELIEKYVGKGSKIGIVGRLQTGSYTNKDGVKIYTTDIMVEEIDFLDSKKASDGDAAPGASINQDDFLKIPDGTETELPFS